MAIFVVYYVDMLRQQNEIHDYACLLNATQILYHLFVEHESDNNRSSRSLRPLSRIIAPSPGFQTADVAKSTSSCTPTCESDHMAYISQKHCSNICYRNMVSDHYLITSRMLILWMHSKPTDFLSDKQFRQVVYLYGLLLQLKCLTAHSVLWSFNYVGSFSRFLTF